VFDIVYEYAAAAAERGIYASAAAAAILTE
jgi:hypothetical protein